MKEMPTVGNLLERVTGNKDLYMSVCYGDRRTITGYRDKPVVAYGLGYNGFICIIRTQRNNIIGYTFGQKHQLSNYSLSGFCEVDIDVAIKEINKNPLLAEKGINEEGLKNLREKYERPVLGSFEVIEHYSGSSNSTQKYRIVRLKNGKLRGEMAYNYNSKYSGYALKYVMKEFEKKDKPDKSSSSTYIFHSINMSQEIIDLAKGQVLAEDL